VRYLITILLIYFQASTYAQQSTFDTLIKKFDHHRENILHEKIYTHLDRNFYLTGESLWFNIYCVDGSLHKPIDVSKVAYVEILDRNNISVLNAKVRLKNGTGEGSIFIPASIGSDHYTFRAYTQWMKNFSPDFFYHEQITIVNPFIKPNAVSERQVTSGNTYTVNFFPEGGKLVSGIKSKVGFQVIDSKGNGAACKGALVNENSDTVATFSTLANGLGSFDYKPQGNVRAVITDNFNRVSTHKFPTMEVEGLVMSVKDSGEHIRTEVRYNDKNLTGSYIFLLVHARNVNAHAEVTRLRTGTAVFNIDKQKLPEGISHFTLFSEEMQPICERLFFKYPSESALTINARTEQQQYADRKKCRLNLTTSTSKGAASANLSIAVYKLDSLSTQKERNILQYLWFESDLTGNVESPEFYFSDNSNAKAAMDNLMLTHGWRRFSWNKILNKKQEIKYVPEHRGHIIHGVVTDTDNKPVPGAITYLASPDKIVRIYPSISNSKGEVFFEAPDFIGTRQIIAQTSDTTYKVEVMKPFFSQFKNTSLPVFWLDASKENALVERTVAMQVQDIYVENIRNNYSAPNIDTLAFFGKADETYYLDQYTRFPVMEEVMREYVPGVLVRKRKDGFHFIVLDNLHKSVLAGDPLILLDGVPIFDADKIMALDPRKVRKLEVMTRPYYLGPVRLNGIVSYTTYEGNLDGFRLSPNQVLIDYEGLQLKREFLKPQHEGTDKQQGRIPDQRTLLFWEPNASTDSNGKLQLEFFTSDIEGRYVVVVEGITNDGKAGSTSHVFSVTVTNNQ
jgi:hypothetical protein